MLGSTFIRWKISIAFYFTPDNVDGVFLKPIIEQIIEKAESVGLFMHTVTSDIGPLNLGMWNAFDGIFANRNSAIRNCIVHPVDSNRKLMFMADAPHLLTNLRAALLNNKLI